MSAKKKSIRKSTKSKRAVSKKTGSAKKLARKKQAPPKRARKKASPKKSRKRSQASGGAFSRGAGRPQSGVQSGDLQGLSRRERADSESVDELLEEGNAFEADVVSGVEAAGDADEQEVRTHEVPEDDVPEEYLEKDS